MAEYRTITAVVEIDPDTDLRYRAAAADPMGEANEAAQAVAEAVVELVLPGGEDRG